MHLRSITLRGFKSFPARTRLEFSSGVSVVVGPNGSGKSNITDAVLWALGEQSPLAVRGQTMKDVIFAGGNGVPSARRAEVEVVIDNADRTLDSDFSEVSIVRRLERSGEGEYRLNGARCRLVDVLEVLSDSGLGKEMHSVVSQGRVEEIVHSRPRDRSLLIEEAAGLGKHRKRRRRARLKLERTEDNLARALDVEREARSHLRPLKRQAEAAELHERLERQSLEARLELVRDAARAARTELQAAESAAIAARERRDGVERRLAGVGRRREAAEEKLARQARAREALQARAFAARSAAERIALRLERAREEARTAAEGVERRERRLELAEAGASDDGAEPKSARRLQELETELGALESDGDEWLRAELAKLRSERDEAERRRAKLELAAEEARARLDAANDAAEAARERRAATQRRLDAARGRVMEARSELVALDRFLEASAPASGDGARPLADELAVAPGYEAAVAAVLGPRLRADLVADVPEGERLLDARGEDGGVALLPGGPGASAGTAAGPAPGAERLLHRVSPSEKAREHAERLLGDAWVVDSLPAVRRGFQGVAVTRAGRALFAGSGELRQPPAGGDERVLAERRRRGQLAATLERTGAEEAAAEEAAEEDARLVSDAEGRRDDAEVALRQALQAAGRAADEVHRAEWLLERRRAAPGDGPQAVRRAELAAELRAERRLAEQAELARRERRAEAERLRGLVDRGRALGRAAEEAARALEAARLAVSARAEALAAELEAGAAAGEHTAATLRTLAHEEAEVQERLKDASEAVTRTEVSAQQLRDVASEREAELGDVARRLGLAAEPGSEPLGGGARADLEARVERLARRREQLGPVNPLAKAEYDEAVRHVEELEGQRGDLEAALAELEGLIRETDRRIRESFERTFEAAARNFEEVVEHLFPGGRGHLRLVRPDGPRPVLAGDAAGSDPEADTVAAAGEADREELPDRSEPGVEVEVTPAGKATKRLSLLSGGEKALVALAFMFAVFLARPCPFYILDEVEAALDDVNIDRFLELVRRYSSRSQFIVVTHQKRTMDAADCLYGVSMGGDGVSRVVSRRLPPAADPVRAPSRAA